jgi:hypothetical protein
MRTSGPKQGAPRGGIAVQRQNDGKLRGHWIKEKQARIPNIQDKNVRNGDEDG